MSKYKEAVKRYLPIVVSHFAKVGREITAVNVKKAIDVLIDFRAMADTPEECLDYLYPAEAENGNDEEREEADEETKIVNKIW